MVKGEAAGTRPPLSIVRDSLDNPEPAAKVGRKGGKKDEPAETQLTIPMLPPNCPVEPLGVNGQTHYYLDEHRQLIGLGPDKHGKGHILAMFGRKSQLCYDFWPRFSDKKDPLTGEPIITGWRPEEATKALMHACANRGIFDPQGKVRGTGAHRGANGELILHCGSKILITAPEGNAYADPGLIEGFVYPAGEERPRPDPQEQDTSAGEQLLMLLNSWNWVRPLEDPMLLLGWIGCAMVGGALNWRPNAWVTGSTATGKSTLQLLLRTIFESGALATGDATEAAIRQLLRQQTLPVFFDELEPDDKGDNRKTMGVIKLARLASSGEQAHRGGQSHEGHAFTIRSCFLFSSILLPPMLTQDRNRLAILELNRIPAGSTSPLLDYNELRLLGRRLRKRLVDHWARLDPLIDSYKLALAEVGHSGRSADQFGTLLAVADLLLYDVAEQGNIEEWADRFKASALAEKETDLADEQEIVQFLATSFLQQRGSEEPAPIVRHIEAALEVGLAGGEKASDRLENFGLRIGQLTPAGGFAKPDGIKAKGELFLAIANQHTALDRLFQDGRWSAGTWAQSFARVEGARRRVKVRFAGAKAQWATLVPLSAILELKPE
jgi:hypothetical protein